MEGRGNVALWGISPGIQLLNWIPHAENRSPTDSSFELAQKDHELNILSVGSADPRHILETLKNFNFNYKINFHVIESQAPLIARSMLLLDIIFNDPSQYSIQDKSEKYLEIFGNIFIRQQTWEFVLEKCPQLIRVITDEQGLLSKIFDFKHLKFKEKDDIEFVFKFWRDSKKGFDIHTMWDYRLRKFYASRFDARENLIDWDYHMKFIKDDKKEKELQVIHKREYHRWRTTGIAYEIRDAVMNKPNRTMATVHGLKEDGLLTTKWGYFSDILTGPFLCMGLNSPTPEQDFTKQNGQYTITSQGIAEKSLQACIQNVQDHVYENTPLDEPERPDQRQATPLDPKNTTQYDSFTTSSFNLKELLNFKITVLPFDPEYTFQKKKHKFTSKFKFIFLACHQALYLPSSVELLAEQGLIFVERPRVLLDLDLKQQQLLEKRIMEFAVQSGLEKLDLEHQKNGESNVGSHVGLVHEFHFVFSKKRN